MIWLETSLRKWPARQHQRSVNMKVRLETSLKNQLPGNLRDQKKWRQKNQRLLRGEGNEHVGIAVDIPAKWTCKDAIIDRERLWKWRNCCRHSFKTSLQGSNYWEGKGMKTEEWLQTFLKNEPARKQLLRGEGHENRGMAADIPKTRSF